MRLNKLHHPALVERLACGDRARYERMADKWDIQFYEDPQAELSPGELAVSSELALPESHGLGGVMTMKRTTTVCADNPPKKYRAPQEYTPKALGRSASRDRWIPELFR